MGKKIRHFVSREYGPKIDLWLIGSNFSPHPSNNIIAPDSLELVFAWTRQNGGHPIQKLLVRFLWKTKSQTYLHRKTFYAGNVQVPGKVILLREIQLTNI